MAFQNEVDTTQDDKDTGPRHQTSGQTRKGLLRLFVFYKKRGRKEDEERKGRIRRSRTEIGDSASEMELEQYAWRRSLSPSPPTHPSPPIHPSPPLPAAQFQDQPTPQNTTFLSVSGSTTQPAEARHLTKRKKKVKKKSKKKKKKYKY
jgi:hypothetical protein